METQAPNEDHRTPEEIKEEFLSFRRPQVDLLLDTIRQANWARRTAEIAGTVATSEAAEIVSE